MEFFDKTLFFSKDAQEAVQKELTFPRGLFKIKIKGLFVEPTGEDFGTL